MARIVPSAFRLISSGFSDDDYAADGNHLRWQFDPALGFPRDAVCIERRPSVAIKPGQVNVDARGSGLTDVPPNQTRVFFNGLTITRPDTLISTGPTVPLASDLPPVIIAFSGGSAPYACWASLVVRVLKGDSRVVLEAIHDAPRGEKLMDRAEHRDIKRREIIGRRLPAATRLAAMARTPQVRELRDLLEHPKTASGPPRIRDRAAATVYENLVNVDPGRYVNATAEYVRGVQNVARLAGVAITDLISHLPQWTTVRLEVFADRIDHLRITGHNAVLQHLSWALTEEVMRARDWEPVTCVPILTDEEDYQKRNAAWFNDDIEQMTEDRLNSPLPSGAEPMDDPQSPPSRPPTLDEQIARYGKPWTERLERWTSEVLRQSFSGDLHQSEVTFTQELTEFGQRPGDGIPDLPDIPNVEDQEITIAPYGLLLASAMAFPAARLLGLGYVDRPPHDPDVDRWDYRVTGTWRTIDIIAWAGKLLRDVQAASEALTNATPFGLGPATVDLIQAVNAFYTGAAFVTMATAGNTTGVVALSAFAGGITMHPKPRFAAPASLTIEFESLANPTGDALVTPSIATRSVAHLEWPLPARSESIERSMVMLAAFGRRTQGASQPFDMVLNPIDPDFDVAGGVVPLDVDSIDGAGTADFYDRDVRDGDPYTYGVSHSDPFGRWSSFREAPYTWNYDIPPPPPHGVGAELALDSSSVVELTVSFRWPTDLFPASSHSFLIFVRRNPLAPETAHDPIHWTDAARTPTSSPGPFTLAGDASGAFTHDGMNVAVSFSDETEADPANVVKSYRRYTVTFRAIQLDFADEAAQAFVGVLSHDDRGNISDEVAGPARADLFDPSPPPSPTWPPDPLRSSYADADGFSTFMLDWAGTSSATYEVYRAGERDLIAYLKAKGISTTSYDPAVASNFRAAALKTLALDAVARSAFQKRSDLVKGVTSFADQLPGYASTLYVYVILGRSPSAVLADWPTAPGKILAVEVPRAPLLSQPVVVSARWEPSIGPAPQPSGSGDRVELLVAEPSGISGDLLSYEVYRTRTAAKATDVRTMRILHRLENPVFTVDPDRGPVTTYVDPHTDPWTTYYYRVVARAPSDTGGPGMRSPASSAVKLTTMSSEDPATPDITTAIREGSNIRLKWWADAPETTVGAFVFDVITREPTTGHGHRHDRRRPVRFTPNGDRFELVFDATGVPAGATVHVRVTDPLGRTAESPGELLPPP